MTLLSTGIVAAASGASHEVIVKVGTTFALLLLAAAVRAFCKRARLPFTVMLVLVGVALAQLAGRGPGFVHIFAEYRISSDVILFVFLPTLIFEAAFNLDVRRLQRNLLPVLTLAIPGLLLSTAIIGAIVSVLAGVPLEAALLLGAILSATDPVAVIALFKRLGAPRRLTVLVEGESLFNDATSIVLAGILIEVVMHGRGTASVPHGVLEFLGVFLGGVVVGLVLAWVFGAVLGKIRSDRFIEISLTTILAYASFLIAEEALHVSGVMATVVAGLTMGGWGRTKISPSVARDSQHLWEFLAYVANALIFLLVGLSVVLAELWNTIAVLGCAVLAMLVSRGVVIFALVPIAGRLSEPVDRRFQAVMYWGGLRGAIALAIVLQLPQGFEHKDKFVAVVTGAVLFTLLVQGLSIEKLLHKLGLDEPPLSDTLAMIEGMITSKRKALERVPELQAGGLFSSRVADAVKDRYAREIDATVERLDSLCHDELDSEQERRILFLRCFGQEMTFYYDMFSKRHLSENAYRRLAFSVAEQVEAMRHHGVLPKATLFSPRRHRFHLAIRRGLDRLPGCARLVRRLRAERTAREYERAWGRHQACASVLAHLDDMPESEHGHQEAVDEVRAKYRHWLHAARERIDSIAAQFPEFVQAMQQGLAQRLLVQAQHETIEQEARAGMIPAALADKILEQLDEQASYPHEAALSELHIDATELLRKVPFFKDTPPDEFARAAALLRERTTPSGEVVIRQGQTDGSLYLIARGVVRVLREEAGESHVLATLVAGEFFGEIALLTGSPRTASCRTVTPCALYELHRGDLDDILAACPAMRGSLEKAAREHQRDGA